MSTITEMKTKHAGITERIKAIEAEGKATGSVPSTTAREQLRLEAEAAGLAAGIKAAETAKPADQGGAADEIAGMSNEPGIKSHTKGNHLALTGVGAKAAARDLAGKMLGAGVGVKSLTGAGTVVTGTPMADQTPIELDKVPNSFLDLLTVAQRDTPAFTYLRQTVRDSKAGVWKSGQKAESKFTVESIDGKLAVIAHVSEGIDRYTLVDNSALGDFLSSEMLAGLRDAVEDQVINGDGTGANITGILATAGITTQAFATDLVTTFRKAITSLESIGRTPGAFIMSPAVWESLELARNTSGQFDLAHTAIDRAARKLHGVQVVVSNALPADTAVLLDLDAVKVDTDNHGIVAEWGTAGNDFTSNQSRLLVEGRFGVSVLRPTGVVKIATAGE